MGMVPGAVAGPSGVRDFDDVLDVWRYRDGAAGSRGVRAGMAGWSCRAFGRGHAAMARYYVRRSPVRWVTGFLVVVIALAIMARVASEWLLPLVPLAGAGLLTIALVRVGFRRRRQKGGERSWNGSPRGCFWRSHSPL
jgi:hypothetical protein